MSNIFMAENNTIKKRGEVKMVCYMVPLAVAMIASVVWAARRRGPAGWWLNLLLYGGAIFGLVDHLWHGELFLISGTFVMDLALGAVITAVIFAGWGISLGIARMNPELARRMGYRLGVLKTR
jgi:hypothetical protein